MKIVLLIDTEAKKNTVKSSLTTQLQSAFATGIIKSWTMDYFRYLSSCRR